MPNVWDDQRQVWVDTDTGNTFKPVDKGGDGIWHSPQGTMYVNGQWTQPGGQPANNGTMTTQSQPGTGTGQGAFQYVPGYGYQVNAQQYQYQTNLNNVGYQNEQQLQQMRNQSAMAVAQLQAQVQAETAKGNNASAERIAQLNYQLGVEQNRLRGVELEINKAAEMRQERALQAQLAANPQDFVAYEYYKRMLGNPSTLTAVGMGTNNSTGGSPNSSGGVATPSVASTGDMLGGGSYSPAPPAYSDASLANVGNNIINPSGPEWSPNLSGTGAFGTHIDAPNQIGRSEFGSLSNSEQGILTSLLNAGINMNGRQVSIDPGDYFSQMQKSWVPTLDEVKAPTTYRE